jgi:hypothetical protein
MLGTEAEELLSSTKVSKPPPTCFSHRPSIPSFLYRMYPTPPHLGVTLSPMDKCMQGRGVELVV